MSHSQRLSLSEVRAAFRLIGEVRDLGDDWHDWRAHLLAELGRLVGAKAGTCCELLGPPWLVDGRPVLGGVIIHSIGSDAGRRIMQQEVEEGDFTEHPLTPVMVVLLGRSFTRSRRQMADDPTWYRSETFERYHRDAGIDDALYSVATLPRPDCVHSITLHRALGERQFQARQRALLRLAHAELAHLWWTATTARPADPSSSLPLRLRQTLARLRTGDSEKQVARALGLSQHTVHHYIAELHRRFGVSSRGELLVRYATRPDFRPRLSVST
jgi:DNA-binding CsgD family transcriptional regulator